VERDFDLERYREGGREGERERENGEIIRVTESSR